MSLKGKIESKERFIGLLRALADLKKTGTLLVTEPDVERRLFFEDGAIVAAASSRAEESFGHFLIEKAILQEHTLHNAEKLLDEHGALLGQELVDLAVMTEDEVERAIRLKVKKTISDILSNPEGTFELVRERLPDRKRVAVSLDPAELLVKEIRELEKHGKGQDSPELEPLEDALDPMLDVLDRFQGKYAATARPKASKPSARPVKAPHPTATERIRRSPAATEGPRRSAIWGGIVLLAVVVLSSLGYWAFKGTPDDKAATVPTVGHSAAEPVAAEGARDTSGVARAPDAKPAGQDASPSGRTARRQPPRTARQSVRRPPAPEAAGSVAEGATAPHQGTVTDETSPASTDQVSQVPPAVSPPAKAAQREKGLPARSASGVGATSRPKEGTGVAGEVYARAEIPAGADSPQLGAKAEVLAAKGPAPAEPKTGGAQPPPPAKAEPAGEEGENSSGWQSSVFAAKPTLVKVKPAGKPAVQPGDLVEPGPDVIDPVLLEHPKLKYPKQAKRKKIEAVVRVRVLVDEKGNVLEAKIDKPVGYGLDEAALSVARRARFIPATKGTVFVKMWTVLPLEYRLKKKK